MRSDLGEIRGEPVLNNSRKTIEIKFDKQNVMISFLEFCQDSTREKTLIQSYSIVLRLQCLVLHAESSYLHESHTGRNTINYVCQYDLSFCCT